MYTYVQSFRTYGTDLPYYNSEALPQSAVYFRAEGRQKQFVRTHNEHEEQYYHHIELLGVDKQNGVAEASMVLCECIRDRSDTIQSPKDHALRAMPCFNAHDIVGSRTRSR